MMNSNLNIRKRRFLKHALHREQQGMTLLEILVSLLLLAVGMLGIASMMLISNQTNNSSYLKQQAIQSIHNIFDSMRSNSAVAKTGSYNVTNTGTSGLPTTPSTPPVVCTTSTCSATQLASYDAWNWLANDVSNLPNGSGTITTAAGAAGSTIVTVTVQWDDSPAQNVVGATGQQSVLNPNFVQISIQSEL